LPLWIRCRHTVGLNYTAIGIEHVGTSDAQILHNAAEMRADPDLASEHELKSLDEQAGLITRLAFDRDDTIVTAGCPPQGIKRWDVAKGSERMSFAGSGAFASSPDAALLAIDDKSTIHIYDPERNDLITELSLGRPDLWATQLVFTCDGRHLAALASNGTVHILRLPKRAKTITD
jgi:WD40 repeat protein